MANTYKIIYQTGIENQNWTEINASSEMEARSEFNRSWLGGSVTILTVKQVGGKPFEERPFEMNFPENPDAPLIKVGDKVVCVYSESSSLVIGNDYIVVREAGPGKNYGYSPNHIFVKDATTGINDNQSRSRLRFKIVGGIDARPKGQAPGLTLIDLRGRKGVAPNLKLN